MIHAEILEGGITCNVQVQMMALDGPDREKFGELLRDSFSPQEFGAMARDREQGCGDGGQTVSEAVKEVGTLRQASCSCDVEQIEVDGSPNSAVNGVNFLLDGPEMGWMCGQDGTTDFIWEFNPLSYAHYYRQYLRYDGVGGLRPMCADIPRNLECTSVLQ